LINGEKVLVNKYMFDKFIFLFFFLIFSSCGNQGKSLKVDNELKFNYKAQVNLYSIYEKKVIKKFYNFSYHEYLARNNINRLCLDYIKINKLDNMRCIYMGTKYTEKLLAVLD